MKLLPSLILAACLATPSIAMAENPGPELAPAAPSESPAPVVDQSTKSDEFTTGYKKDANFMYLEYLGRFEDNFDLGLALRLHWFDFGALMNVKGEGDFWMLRAGVGGSYYLSKNLFIDGAVGLTYAHSSFETRQPVGTRAYTPIKGGSSVTKYETVKYSEGGVGAYLLPRIGTSFGKGFSISIGYQMNAYKFKFDNFFDKGLAVIGIGWVN